MSRYGDSERDNLSFELDDFLKTHTVSELLELVKDSVELKEQGFLD